MTKHEAVEILEEIKTLDDSMFAYSQAYNDALEMAIEALKAQEPKVMTPDEVRTWISVPRIDREPIWVETENSVNAWIVSDEYWDMQIDVNLSSDLYGKTWRCWTSRPSKEEMEATSWEP